MKEKDVDEIAMEKIREALSFDNESIEYVKATCIKAKDCKYCPYHMTKNKVSTCIFALCPADWEVE